ncbi:MAG: hypothetical protein CEE40_07955 [Chloroflexi bacterium B3_Chlor]|nr:MAG: hypothetical protein CEE40_07955 [Chloroflexi bacterium B3_Chlor]
MITVLCSLLPLAAIVAIWVLGVPLDSVLLFAIVLLCPLGHLLMMRGGHQQGSSGDLIETPSSQGDRPA